MRHSIRVLAVFGLAITCVGCAEGDDENRLWTAAGSGVLRLDGVEETTPLEAVTPFVSGGPYEPHGTAFFIWWLADSDAEEERSFEVHITVYVARDTQIGVYEAVPSEEFGPLVVLHLDKTPTELPVNDWFPVDGQLKLLAWESSRSLSIELEMDASFSQHSAGDTRAHFAGFLSQHKQRERPDR